MPEHKNKNKAKINLEINEMNNQYDIKKKDFILILGKFYEKKEKNEPYNIEELFSVRKVLIKSIETLQRDIERLPVPQNNNRLSNNLEENYNEPLTRFTPKLETTNMTKKEKLKMIRKGAEKSRSKLLKNRNLGRSTFQSNSIQMKQEMNQEDKDAEWLKQYYREEREKAVREYEKHLIRVNRCSREEREKQVRKFEKQLRPMNSNNNNRNNNNRFGPEEREEEKADVWTGKELITLRGNNAIDYWEGSNNALYLNFWHSYSNNNRNNNTNNNNNRF